MSGTVHSALVRLVLSGAQRYGADPTVLAREADLPGWALTDAGTVRYRVGISDPGVSTIATEFVLGSLLQRACHAVGRRVTPSRVEFAGPAPRSHGELAEGFGTDGSTSARRSAR